MRKSISKLALVATFGLALTLTFSCSSDNDDDEGVGGEYYNPNNEYYRCNGGVVEAKCGDVWFNISKYNCKPDVDEYSNIHYTLITLEQYYEQNVNEYVRCGNSYYPSNMTNYYRCQSGVIEAKCGDVWYNTSKYGCTNGNTITLEQLYEQAGYVRCR